MTRQILRVLCASAIALAACFGTNSADAGHGYYAPRYHWRTVVTYRTVRQPVTESVIRYDDCGRAYQVDLTRYRSVTVPVERRVKIHY